MRHQFLFKFQQNTNKNKLTMEQTAQETETETGAKYSHKLELLENSQNIFSETETFVKFSKYIFIEGSSPSGTLHLAIS